MCVVTILAALHLIMKMQLPDGKDIAPDVHKARRVSIRNATTNARLLQRAYGRLTFTVHVTPFKASILLVSDSATSRNFGDSLRPVVRVDTCSAQKQHVVRTGGLSKAVRDDMCLQGTPRHPCIPRAKRPSINPANS